MPNLSRAEQLQLLVPLLRGHTAFTDFLDEEIGRFAEAAEIRFLPQGARLIEQAQRGNEFFVVLTGQLRAIDVNYDPPHLLNYHTPGQILGVRALLTNEPRAATVEVVTDAQVAAYNRNDWEWLIHRHPRIEAYFEGMERDFEQRSSLEFPGRQWDEVIVASSKRHILVFIAKLTFPLALLIVPILLLIIFDLIGVDVLTATAGNQFFGALAVLPFIILSLGLIIYHYLDWRNDDFILTTKRFIHIERKLLYGEQRDEAPLTRIQDVWLAYPGFLNRFDYYHLRIKTAGAGDIRINGITQAQQMKDAIFQEKERVMERVRAAAVAATRQQLAQQLQWQGTLEETILSVVEEEGGITTSNKPRRLPGFLHYFIPRLQEILPDGTTIVWRKHYWVLLWIVGLPLACVLITAYLLLASVVGWFPLYDMSTWFIQVILGLGLVASLGWYLWCYDGWRRDIYQVTETRISDVTSSSFGLGGELRSEGSLQDIQNITYQIPNFLYSMLNMGNVVIETAGTKQTFSFHRVYNPSGVQQEIFNRMVRVQQKEREQRRSDTGQDLTNVLAEYQYLLEKAVDKGLVNFGGEKKIA